MDRLLTGNPSSNGFSRYYGRTILFALAPSLANELKPPYKYGRTLVVQCITNDTSPKTMVSSTNGWLTHPLISYAIKQRIYVFERISSSVLLVLTLVDGLQLQASMMNVSPVLVAQDIKLSTPRSIAKAFVVIVGASDKV